MTEFLTITVVISNWKRQKCIPSIIQQLDGQAYPKDKYEVIIVDDDTPNKEEVYQIVRKQAQEHPTINLSLYETHKQVTRNPALRYNIGAKKARNEIVLLNESDVLQEAEYLQTVNAEHQADTKLFLGPELVSQYPDGHREVESFRGPCDLGGSVRREHYHAITGFDERTRGWGGIEDDFHNRLKEIGVNYRKCTRLIALHRRVELCGIDPAEFFMDTETYRGWPPKAGVRPNPETWGTLDTLEQINLKT